MGLPRRFNSYVIDDVPSNGVRGWHGQALVSRELAEKSSQEQLKGFICTIFGNSLSGDHFDTVGYKDEGSVRFVKIVSSGRGSDDAMDQVHEDGWIPFN